MNSSARKPPTLGWTLLSFPSVVRALWCTGAKKGLNFLVRIYRGPKGLTASRVTVIIRMQNVFRLLLTQVRTFESNATPSFTVKARLYLRDVVRSIVFTRVALLRAWFHSDSENGG